MCYSRNYLAFQHQQRNAEEEANKERRTGAINKLQEEANRHAAEPTDTTTTAGEFASAK